jgi:hypothetical protein
VFDDGSVSVNGSPLLCVDPNDPTGPTIARPVTRVAEYSLNQVNHTATLVWSYSVPGRLTSFAGSAQRLSNGDTMVGWAADNQPALATEVNAAGNPVWELDNNAGLFSYRALKFAAPDAIPPVVNITAPADHATYPFGQKVNSDFSCTDRGGSNLQTCSGPVVEGGQIDTSTPGRHNFTVVATDGAGNTTTLTRTYTVGVPPASYQPDGLIKRIPGGRYVGGNVYGGISKQRIKESIAKSGHVALAEAKFQNDGNRVDRITITGSAGTAKFAVVYLVNGVNVTSQVVAGTYKTPSLEPGQAIQMRIRVTRTNAAKVGNSRTVKLSAKSLTAPAKHDSVATTIRATK